MPITDAQKRARDKWNKENMTVIVCNVTKKKKEEFKRACSQAKTNPNAVLLDAVNSFIDEHTSSDNDVQT